MANSGVCFYAERLNWQKIFKKNYESYINKLIQHINKY